MLVITAVRERFTGTDGIARDYTSARLKTLGTFAQAYGRFEGRMKLPRGQVVTIVVSTGNKVAVPEITGLSEADARATIEAAGLFVSFVDYQGCDKLGADICARYGPGTAVSSQPRPGTRIERGSGVTLGVRAP